MGEQRIEAALREATDTQNVNIGAGALTSVPDVFRESFGDSSAVVVADGNTFEVAGKEVRRRLERADAVGRRGPTPGQATVIRRATVRETAARPGDRRLVRHRPGDRRSTADCHPRGRPTPF